MRLYFWICLWAMVPGLLIRIPFGGAGILLLDIILPPFVAIFLIQKFLWKHETLEGKYLLPGALFAFCGLFSFFLNAWQFDLKEQILAFSYLVRWGSVLVFGVAAREYYGGGAEPFYGGIWAILGTILLSGYLQFYLIPDISKFSTVGGFDPHIGRFLGTWMDPNFVAGLLAFFLPVMIGRWYGLSWQKERWFLSFLILASLYAGFLTFSRSGYLGIASGLFLFFLFWDRKMIVIGGLIILLSIVNNERALQRTEDFVGTLRNILLQDTDAIDPTSSLRLQSWQKTLELWQKYPLLGIGYNTYRSVASEEGLVDESYFSSGGSDASLLTVLVTTGGFGFICFLWWYLGIWGRLFGIYRKERALHLKDSSLTLGIWAGFSALLLHSFFVNSLLFPLILLPIMAFVGIALSKSQ